jgi:LysR family nitrogen assimilation transcriptional regulator
MDSRRLRYFVQIVDHGSITRAAAAAGVAQPALSQQVAILETELRVKLLDRGVSGVAPTAAGKVLYGRAQTILRHLEELRLAVHGEVQPLSGTVILGVSPTMVQRFVLPLIEKVCVQHPEMHLQIVEDGSGPLREYLNNGRVELTLSPTPPDDENVEGEQILNEPLILIYPPTWDSLDSASLAELAKLPWIATRTPHSIRRLLDAAFTANNLVPRVVVEIDSLHSVLETIKRGIGVTLLPRGIIDNDVSQGAVKWCPFGPLPLMRPMYLTHRRSPALAPPAKFVRELLREIAADLPVEEQSRAAHPGALTSKPIGQSCAVLPRRSVQ